MFKFESKIRKNLLTCETNQLDEKFSKWRKMKPRVDDKNYINIFYIVVNFKLSQKPYQSHLFDPNF